MGFFNYLIAQSIKPKGLIGKFMLKTMNNAHQNLFKFGLSNIQIHENCTLLDVGFGGGKVLKMLSKQHKDIQLFGIDFSAEAVKVALKNNKKDILTGKINLQQADIEKIPFPDNYFDIITAFQTHYHWSDLPNKVKEIHRVLKPHGQFLVVAEKYKIGYHAKAYKTADEMIELFEKIGFTDIVHKETKYNICIKGIKVS